MELVLQAQAAQVTLVPDAPDALTSNAGWNTVQHFDFLKASIRPFKAAGIRVSIFVDPVVEMIQAAHEIGADRIELYTEPYATQFVTDRHAAVAPYSHAAQAAKALGLGVNAGHDLSLENLAFFVQNVPCTDEVSIGHALVCDALYLGLERTIAAYLACLQSQSQPREHL